MSSRSLLTALTFLMACNTGSESTEDTAEAPADLRTDFPDPTGDAVVFVTPDLTIPAYADVQFCYVTTYTGPDVGITHMTNYQGPGGHHLVILGTTTSAREIPDGTLWDCTKTEDMNMEDSEPVIFGGSVTKSDTMTVNELDLPDGMGVVLQSGQRLVVQAHYINATATPMLVRDEAQFEILPEDQITTWAAPMALNGDAFRIPAGTTDYTFDFGCTWDQAEPVDVLFLGGHMHEWGKAFATSITRAGSDAPTPLWDEPVWDPVYRDAPAIQSFAPGELTIQPGDQLHTSCSWFNDQAEDLVFPHEMCVTFALVYPAKLPWICNNGN